MPTSASDPNPTPKRALRGPPGIAALSYLYEIVGNRPPKGAQTPAIYLDEGLSLAPRKPLRPFWAHLRSLRTRPRPPSGLRNLYPPTRCRLLDHSTSSPPPKLARLNSPSPPQPSLPPPRPTPPQDLLLDGDIEANPGPPIQYTPASLQDQAPPHLDPDSPRATLGSLTPLPPLILLPPPPLYLPQHHLPPHLLPLALETLESHLVSLTRQALQLD